MKNEKYFSTGIKTASELLESCKGYLKEIMLFTDGTNDAKLIIYDNADTYGTNDMALAGLSVKGSNLFRHLPLPPIKFETGLYARLEGTGASYILLYSRIFKGG